MKLEQNVIIYYDENGNSADANGDPYEYSDYTTFLADCQDACNESAEMSFSICELKLEAMKRQISPEDSISTTSQQNTKILALLMV